MVKFLGKNRLSWSKLNTWANYNKQDAIDSILGYRTPSTPAMELGTRLHTKIEVQQLNPLDLPGEVMKWEYKDSVVFNDWLELSFVVDFIADETIADWKSGRSNDPMQIKVYGLLMEMLGHSVSKGAVVRIQEIDKKIVTQPRPRWITIDSEALEEAWGFIEPTATEIRNYFEENEELYKKIEDNPSGVLDKATTLPRAFDGGSSGEKCVVTPTPAPGI